MYVANALRQQAAAAAAAETSDCKSLQQYLQLYSDCIKIIISNYNFDNILTYRQAACAADSSYLKKECNLCRRLSYTLMSLCL